MTTIYRWEERCECGGSGTKTEAGFAGREIESPCGNECIGLGWCYFKVEDVHEDFYPPAGRHRAFIQAHERYHAYITDLNTPRHIFDTLEEAEGWILERLGADRVVRCLQLDVDQLAHVTEGEYAEVEAAFIEGVQGEETMVRLIRGVAEATEGLPPWARMAHLWDFMERSKEIVKKAAQQER